MDGFGLDEASCARAVSLSAWASASSIGVSPSFGSC